MLVKLTILNGAVRVDPVEGTVAGGSIGSFTADSLSAIVRPGQSYRGWKYARLRRLGDGQHELLAKRDPLRQRSLVLRGDGGSIVHPLA